MFKRIAISLRNWRNRRLLVKYVEVLEAANALTNGPLTSEREVMHEDFSDEELDGCTRLGIVYQFLEQSPAENKKDLKHLQKRFNM